MLKLRLLSLLVLLAGVNVLDLDAMKRKDVPVSDSEGEAPAPKREKKAKKPKEKSKSKKKKSSRPSAALADEDDVEEEVVEEADVVEDVVDFPICGVCETILDQDVNPDGGEVSQFCKKHPMHRSCALEYVRLFGKDAHNTKCPKSECRRLVSAVTVHALKRSRDFNQMSQPVAPVARPARSVVAPAARLFGGLGAGRIASALLTSTVLDSPAAGLAILADRDDVAQAIVSPSSAMARLFGASPQTSRALLLADLARRGYNWWTNRPPRNS